MAKIINTLKDAEERIEELIDQVGRPHTHNLVGFVLRKVDEKFGRKEANRLIDHYDLDDLFGVNKEPLNEAD